MKLTVNKKSLSTALSAVGSIVPARSPKPLLLNVRLQVKDGTAILTGSDSEIDMRYEIPDVRADEDGELLLPTRRAIEILREMPGDNVTLDVDGKHGAVRIVGDRSEFRLPSADPAEFPVVSQFDAQECFSIPAKALGTMIRRTIFATDPTSSRYALGGVMFEFGAHVVNLVATDSRRLAMASATLGRTGNPPEPSKPPIVPVKTLAVLERLLPDTDDPVLCSCEATGIAFSVGPAVIRSRLMEGRFPRYQDVIPKKHEVSVEVIAGQLHSVVRQAQIVTSEESRGVDFRFGNGGLDLRSEAADVGNSRVEMPICYDGEPVVIRLDPRFVADFLKAVAPETQVSVKLLGSDDPGVLTTVDGYTYVIMPLSRE